LHQSSTKTLGSDSEPKEVDLGEDFLIREGDRIRELFQQAVNRELRIHKALGNPIVGIEGGEIVWTQPEDIVIDDDEPARS